MTIEAIIDLSYTVMSTAFYITAPVFGISMAIGILVAIFQAATQINEQSLTFVPKLIGMGVALVIFGPYILDKLTGFTVAFITSVSTVGR